MDVEALLRKQMEAFNARDPGLLADLLAEDYTWWQVGEDGPQRVTRGREETLARLGAFFAAMPYARSRLAGVLQAGSVVAAIEKDTFEKDGRTVERTTLGVYEYRDGRLRRAWAFPVTD